MTDLMFQLRRSPRRLLERDQHPGPGPGQLALILARPGVGKTAMLVGVGIDALLAGQKVLYISFDRTVEKVNEWFDEILAEMLQREKKSEHLSAGGPRLIVGHVDDADAGQRLAHENFSNAFGSDFGMNRCCAPAR